MAKRASQAGAARTTDRTSAGQAGLELIRCDKRRRWTAEQKHKIVAEGTQPDMSAAMVARKHGITTSQFYAWRQQLLLRRGLDGGADFVPDPVSADATLSATEPDTATTVAPRPAAPTASAVPASAIQLRERIDVPLPDSSATEVPDDDSAAKRARTIDRKSTLGIPAPIGADGGHADQSGSATTQSVLVDVLGHFRHGYRIDRIGWSPVPRQQLLKLVAFGAAGDQTFEHVSQPDERLDAIQLRRADQRQGDGPMVCRAVGSTEQRILASNRHPLHPAFNNIGVDLQPPVFEEQYQAGPVPQCVADGICQERTARQARQCGFQPAMQGLNDWLASLLADRLSVLRS